MLRRRLEDRGVQTERLVPNNRRQMGIFPSKKISLNKKFVNFTHFLDLSTFFPFFLRNFPLRVVQSRRMGNWSLTVFWYVTFFVHPLTFHFIT
jgi:hypothetical protein